MESLQKMEEDVASSEIEIIPIRVASENFESLPGVSGLRTGGNASDSDPDLNETVEEDYLSGASSSEDENPQPKKRSKSMAPKPVVSKLSTTLKALVGEANLRVARGDIETAQKMCFEVIRQCPDAYEPYATLAQIYEKTDHKKFGIYQTLVAHLNTGDVDNWRRLAEHHLSDNKILDAIKCYSRALKAKPYTIELHLERLRLAEQLGIKRKILKYKVTLASKLPKHDYKTIIEIVREVVPLYHEKKAYARAIEVLEIPFKRIPKKVTPDLINMFLELLILTDKYAQCLDIFTQYCNFEFELSVNENNQLCIDRYSIPDVIEIDIRCKFIICVVKLRSHHLIPSLIDAVITNYDVHKIGDLYLDIAESLMSENYHEDALKLLVPLVKSPDYSMAAVWLKYAECLDKCRLYEPAIDAYYTVLRLAPQHVEVLYPLAMILLKLDKKDEALAVLHQDLSQPKIDVAVLIERMKLLRQIGDSDEYFRCVELLLSRHCVVFQSREELKITTTFQAVSSKHLRIRKMRELTGGSCEVVRQVASIREPDVETEYRLFREVLDYALAVKRYDCLEKFAFMALTSKRFSDKFEEVVVYALISCIYNSDMYLGYNILRDCILNRTPQRNNRCYNLLAFLGQGKEEHRCNKFVTRAQIKNPDPVFEIIEANIDLKAGLTSNALAGYMKRLKTGENSPILCLLIGVTLLQMYHQRKVIARQMTDRKDILTTASSFFVRYSQTRSRQVENEVNYNMGRAYHQMGVMHLAEHHYKLVLGEEGGALVDGRPEILSLKHEAAYNLHLIYKSSGNWQLARKVLVEHLTI